MIYILTEKHEGTNFGYVSRNVHAVIEALRKLLE